MPEFDVVTGISTGSLIAPYAFLGTPKALDDISRLYTEAVDEIKPSLDWLFFIKRTGGLLNRSKLERTVGRVVSEEFSAELRRGFAADRLLLAGTTNLNQGMGRIWDISRELTPNPAGLERYRTILLATTAIPGAFAPVMIDGEPHVDGGVVGNTLLGADLGDFRRLAARLKAAGATQPVRVRLWVLINWGVYPDVQQVNHRGIDAVRKRSNALIFKLKELMSLTRYWELSEAVTAGVPGLTMEMKYTALPLEITDEAPKGALFNQAFMKRIDQYGFERARGSSPWDVLPVSSYARPAK